MAQRQGPAAQKTGWQLLTAKAKSSELFQRVREEGPQLVTRNGKDCVVVVALEGYEKLTGLKKRKPLSRFLAESPLAGSGIRIERSREAARKVEL